MLLSDWMKLMVMVKSWVSMTTKERVGAPKLVFTGTMAAYASETSENMLPGKCFKSHGKVIY